MTALFDTWVTGGLLKLFLLIGEIHSSSGGRLAFWELSSNPLKEKRS